MSIFRCECGRIKSYMFAFGPCHECGSNCVISQKSEGVDSHAPCGADRDLSERSAGGFGDPERLQIAREYVEDPREKS